MAEFPSLPLFTDAWVADTKHLSRLERGTYHDLLVLMWRTPDCRVPNDDVWLGKRLGMTATEVAAELRPIIVEFCQTDGNWITQKRLQKEWQWCRGHSKKQSDNAKALWRNKKKSSQVDATTPLVAYAPTPTPIPTPNKKEPGANAPAAEAAPEPTQAELERDYFRRGKQVCGKSAGGLLTELLKSKQHDLALARSVIEIAATKDVPREYVSAAIRAGPRTYGGGNAVPRPGSREDTRERTVNALRKVDLFIEAHADDEGGSGATPKAPSGRLRLCQPPRS